MGRKKKYDEAEALEKAMYLFWRNGYRAVSTRNLADEMGINQYSLYASFQSKEVLFAAALEQYLQAIVCDWFLKPLVDQADGLTAIRQFFEAFVEPGNGTTPTGCLICNTIVDAEKPGSDVQSVIDRYQSTLTDAFARALRNARPDASSREIASKADLLLCLMLGIAVKKRNGFEGAPVQNVVDQIMGFVGG
jgi:TetR/AcrR family transcriptional repressor of nem operon